MPASAKVISASRRTDLVGCYPEFLVQRLKEFPPGEVHTLVLWTKNPLNLLRIPQLNEFIALYPLYLHLSITGLGGTELEPRIPPADEVIALIPELIRLTGSPQRISWRFDPIVRISTKNRTLENLSLFDQMAEKISPTGINTVRTSFVTYYPKVLKRMEKAGFSPEVPSPEEKHARWEEISRKAETHGFQLFACAVPGLPRSACIDGKLLNRLRPEGPRASERKAAGQRQECGCTESYDIGHYLACRHDCVYCYANPQMED